MWSFKNRGFATAVTVVLVLLSALFGARRSLFALKSDVNIIFENGVAGDGHSIRQILDARVSKSKNLVTIAKLYMDSKDPLITELSLRSDELLSAEDVSSAFNADIALTSAYEKLSEMLLTKPLEAYYAAQLRSISDDLKSDRLKLSHDGYNDTAAEFNRILKTFPANILSKITSVKKAELFG